MIELENLTKRYGPVAALDGVTFRAEPGRVTGFLGPNGAGKSTAMRILTGLATPTGGHALVLGRPYAQLPNPARLVGTLLDASAQHDGRTGREILTLAALGTGVPRSRVGEVLRLVGLTDAEAGRRLGQYSLGMRQRLGLAHALLGDPEVLVLDEPANGLDPQGIHWMRELLRGLAAEGRTVLLSSHLLHEVEQTADDVVMIGRGRVVAQGSTRELVGGTRTLVRSTDDARLAAALRADDLDAGAGAGGGLLVDAAPERVGAAALTAGIALVELRPTGGAGLEEIFLQLTADTSRSAA